MAPQLRTTGPVAPPTNSSASEIAALPASTRRPVTRIEPGRGGWKGRLEELWTHRELLYFLAWRDVKVRYKQTVFGVAWAILQPIATVIVFTVVFAGFANIPSEGFPYPVFAFAALLPWTYFSAALTRGGQSLVASASLVSKIYFPRLMVPVTSLATPLVDFALALVAFFGLMAWYGLAPPVALVAAPLFLLLASVTALGSSLWLSALNVRYRDVGFVIPFLAQLWLYLSPVIYPLSSVPEGWRVVYGLNPMVAVIEGFRWSLLGADGPDALTVGTGVGVALVLLGSGLRYFSRTERTFADVI